MSGRPLPASRSSANPEPNSIADVHEPIHERIFRYVTYLIESGELVEGSRLPSEAEFQALFSVSRTPVRQGLRRLQNTGAIIRAQGRGSFVAATKLGGALRPMGSFGNDLRRTGHQVLARTLSVSVEVPPRDVRVALGLADGVAAPHVHRLFVVDGEPLALFDHWLTDRLPVTYIRNAGDFPSLTELSTRMGIVPYRGVEFIGASAATPEQAKLLACNLDSPLLALRRVSSDREHLPFEHTTYFVRADRYEYRVDLVGNRY